MAAAGEGELGGQEKIALITQNLQEVLKLEIIEDVILKQNRPLKIYWGKQTPKLPTDYWHYRLLLLQSR
jgi:hypothetical protein